VSCKYGKNGHIIANGSGWIPAIICTNTDKELPYNVQSKCPYQNQEDCEYYEEEVNKIEIKKE
jgi:hypothetical protein